VAVCLAAELSARGNTVVLIDADMQRSSCQWAQPGNLPFPVYEIALSDQNYSMHIGEGERVATWVQELVQATKFYDYVIIDTAPHEYAVSISIAVSDLVIVPCTPSGLDLNATTRTLEIIDMVRARKQGHPGVILVPNRVDVRTRDGRQIGLALTRFNEIVSPTIGDRAAFVRAFAAGRSVAEMPDASAATREIQMLGDFVEKTLGTFRSSDGELSLVETQA
jgi:chromosome partitioning protein